MGDVRGDMGKKKATVLVLTAMDEIACEPVMVAVDLELYGAAVL